MDQDQDNWSIDWDQVTDVNSFVDSLMTYNILIFNNEDPDIRVIEIEYDVQVDILIQNEIGSDPFQTIICNRDETTKHTCPFFRIIMQNFGSKSTINFKLKTFFDRVGVPDLNSRCTKAIAVGLHALHMLNSPMNIPSCFTTTSIDLIRFGPGIEIEVTCQDPVPTVMRQGTPLCNIYNLLLPTFVPENVQELIISFCRSPVASIIDDEIKRVCYNWDMWLTLMFSQREPRIPPSIAWQYHASTVQNTAANATRYFLADPVSLVG